MNLEQYRNQHGSRKKLRIARRQRTRYYYTNLRRFNAGLSQKEPVFCFNCRYSKCRCDDGGASA